ncbi:PAS domain S-box protein [Maribacter sp. 2307ULW6-5]|uniref:PAS domain S-box protein n=1 Tax=Maribacter sp. 2307ULW6-5 TaxID=3386275 RepID=UPI0039BC2CA6
MIGNTTEDHLLQAIFDASVEGVMVVSDHGAILKANASCHAMFGYAQGELLQQKMEILVPQRYRERHQGHRKRYARRPGSRVMGGNLDLWGLRKDGTEFPVDVSLSPTAIGGRSVTIAYVRNATQRKEQLRQLRESNKVLAETNRKYGTLIGNLQGVVFRCKNDRQYPMEFISPGCALLTGHAPEAFTEGRVSFGELILAQDRDRVWKEIQRAIAQERPFVLNHGILDQSGGVKAVRTSGSPVRGHDGGIVALEGFIADVSAERKIEGELRSKNAENRALLDALPDMMFIQDHKGRFMDLYAPEPEKLFMPKEEMLGKDMKEVFPSPIYAKYGTVFKAVLKTGRLQQFEYVHGQGPGQLIFEARTVPLNRHALLTIVRDVTQKKKTEQHLKDSEAKNRAILQALPDLYFLVDAQGHCLDVGAPDASLLPVSAQAMIGKHLSEHLPGEVVQRIMDAYQGSKELQRTKFLEHQMPVKDANGYFESRIVALPQSGFLMLSRDISHRKQTEVNLFIKNLALASAGNGILISDAQREGQPVIYANEAFYRMTGYSENEVLGRNCRFLQNSDRDQEAIGKMAAAMAQGLPCQVQLRNYRKDGTLFWNELTITPVHNNLGELTHFIGVQNDVTQRVLEEEFKDHVRTVLQMIAEHRPLKSIGREIIRTVETNMDRGMASIQMLDTGTTSLRTLVASKLPEAFVRSLDGTVVGPGMGPCGRAAHTKEPVVVKDLEKDDNWREAAALALAHGLRSCWSYPIFSSNKRVLGILAIYHDKGCLPNKMQQSIISNIVQLTGVALEQDAIGKELKKNRALLEGYARELEQKVAERTNELRHTVKELVRTNLQLKDQVAATKAAKNKALESQTMFTAISKNFPKGIIIVFNTAMEIVYIDGGELLRMGYKKEQFEGRHIEDIEQFSPQRIARIKADVERTIQGEQLSFEIQFRKKTYTVNTSPLYAGNNTVKWTLFVYNDISKQKQAETNIRNALVQEQQLNELKSRFISMASHEFRTPLSAILSSATLIRRMHHPDKVQKREKYVGQIESNVRNLVVILNDFLSLGKLEEGETICRPQSFDLVALAGQVLRDLEASKKEGQKLRFSHPEAVPVKELDPKLTKHILVNLVSNAIKYAEEGTEIKVGIALGEGGVTLQVSDAGIGIPQGEQGHLFERFFRAKNAVNIQGTGLGLHIVKQYTELMGGRVRFESKENVGTTFWVDFDLAAEKDGAGVPPLS